MEPLQQPPLRVIAQSDTYVIGESIVETDLIGVDELCGYFEGVDALLDYVLTQMPHAKMDRASSEPRGDSGSFYSFDTFDRAMKTYTCEPSKVRGFKEREAPLRDDASQGNDVNFDVTGDFLDIGRFLEGGPECMAELHNGRPTGRRLSILINLGWAGVVSSKIVNKRSERIQRLVDWLENQGVRVSIMGVRASSTSHIEVLIKDFDQVLDVNDIAVVSNGDFLRRIIFRIDEHSKSWSKGYGNSQTFSKWLKKHPFLPELNGELTVLVDNQCSEDTIRKDFDALEEWLTERLTQIGESPEERYKAILTSGGGMNYDPIRDMLVLSPRMLMPEPYPQEVRFRKGGMNPAAEEFLYKYMDGKW